jgi:hypothetical protein
MVWYDKRQADRISIYVTVHAVLSSRAIRPVPSQVQTSSNLPYDLQWREIDQLAL